MITVRLDVRRFAEGLSMLRKLLEPGDLTRRVLSDSFIRKAQLYLAKQMDAGLKSAASLSEDQTMEVRGQTWKGWAVRMRETRRYGSVLESTRFRMRKYARGSVAKKAGATRDAKTRRELSVIPPRDRPWEKVWKKRGPGNVRYSESSNMMRNTSAMARAFPLMTSTVSGNVVELRPGAYVRYFQAQHDRRPMFVFEPGVDDVAIQKFVTESLAQVLKEMGF